MNSGPAPEQAPKLVRPTRPQIRHPKFQAWQPPSVQKPEIPLPRAQKTSTHRDPRPGARDPPHKLGSKNKMTAGGRCSTPPGSGKRIVFFLPASLGSTHAFFGCIFPHWDLAVFLPTITWLWVCLMQSSVLITCGPIFRGQTFLVTWSHQHILGAW